MFSSFKEEVLWWRRYWWFKTGVQRWKFPDWWVWRPNHNYLPCCMSISLGTCFVLKTNQSSDFGTHCLQWYEIIDYVFNVKNSYEWDFSSIGRLLIGTLFEGPPELPSTCCMSGCANCVWLDYADEVVRFVRGNRINLQC